MQVLNLTKCVYMCVCACAAHNTIRTCVSVCLFMWFPYLCMYACTLTLKSFWHDLFLQVYLILVHPFPSLSLFLSSPFPFTASHFFSSAPRLLNNSLTEESSCPSLPLSSAAVDTYICLSTTLFFSVYYRLSVSFSHPVPLHFLSLLNPSMSLDDIVLNWQLLFFPLMLLIQLTRCHLHN